MGWSSLEGGYMEFSKGKSHNGPKDVYLSVEDYSISGTILRSFYFWKPHLGIEG